MKRLHARDLLDPRQLAAVRAKSDWKGIGLVLHAWTIIAGAVAMVVVWPNPLTFVLAVLLIGSRQLGLAILMHEGAHGALADNPRLNLWLSQWLCAFPVFADTEAYRRYHLKHHGSTQQPDDPDLVLSAPFPITRASYRRKFWRDITGRTGYAQRKAQLLLALGDPAWPAGRRLAHLRERLGRQFAVNLLLAALFAAAGAWWAWPLLWLLPLLTWMMVITRIRNIAEHAMVPDGNDPLRNTRTTLAGPLARLFIAPYRVNYHLEHHLLPNVPCSNLPMLHRLLATGPHGPAREIQPGYLAVMRMATSRPDGDDRRGDVANAARRARGGRAGVDDNQVSGGF